MRTLLHLAKFATILAGYYSYYGQILKRIQIKKPLVWLRIQTFVDWKSRVQVKESKRVPFKEQLRWYANETRKQNKKVVSIPPWQPVYVEANLDEVAKRFTVMVVQPVAKQTYENVDGNRLYTWNKLRIIETISSPEEASKTRLRFLRKNCSH
jgi:hypothetical protein